MRLRAKLRGRRLAFRAVVYAENAGAPFFDARSGIRVSAASFWREILVRTEPCTHQLCPGRRPTLHTTSEQELNLADTAAVDRHMVSPERVNPPIELAQRQPHFVRISSGPEAQMLAPRRRTGTLEPFWMRSSCLAPPMGRGDYR